MEQQLIAYPQSTTLPLTFPTGEYILDLFENEPIPLVLNIDDFTNVAEADASYSKSFDIPGTKNNNIFFNNIFDVTASSNFDTHKKTRIIVKEDTLNTFEGYLQLNDISIKDGAITYNVTIYSEVVNLKDSIGDKVFRDLDLTELNHLYTSNNVENSWTGILNLFNPLPANSFAGTVGATTTSVLKYPMVNWAGHGTNTLGNFFSPYLPDYFRPWVNALYLLKTIFRDAGYTFSSAFLNSTKFNKLYVDFNISGAAASSDYYCDLDNIIGTYTTSGAIANATVATGGQAVLYNLGNDKFTAINNGTEVELFGNLYFNSSSNNVEITLYHTNTTYSANVNSGYVIWNSSTSGVITPGFGSILLDAGDSCWMQIKGIGGSVSIDASTNSSWVSWVLSSNTNQDMDRLLLGFRGDNSQWDYFKGLIDMFKLVILVDDSNPNNLIIEPYKDWVGAGNKLDWTNKIDESEFKYTPIDGLSREVKFKFSEDKDDWITPNLNSPSDWLFGYNYNSNIEIIDKEMDEVEVTPFSDTYVVDLGNGLGTNVMPQIIDSSVTPAGSPLRYWENNLRILYDNGVVNLPNTYTVGGFTNKNTMLLFSAMDAYPYTNTSDSYRFNTVAEQYSSVITLNTLYNTYWLQYIDELYNKDTRIIEVEAYLNSEDIFKLNFNDIILIKSTRYRIYKIEYRAGAMSKLKLITIRNL